MPGHSIFFWIKDSVIYCKTDSKKGIGKLKLFTNGGIFLFFGKNMAKGVSLSKHL